MEFEDDIQKWKMLKEKLLDAVDSAKVKMRKYLMSKNKEELKQELRGFETPALETLCDDIAAIENEDYEICQAIQEVLRERNSN